MTVLEVINKLMECEDTEQDAKVWISIVDCLGEKRIILATIHGVDDNTLLSAEDVE